MSSGRSTGARVSLGREIAEDLRRRIVEGEFAPGSRLPSEADLCSHYRVSRVTVRTAAKALESQGLVDIRHGSGMYVVDFGGQIRSGVQELRSITETIREMGMVPGMEYHSIQRRRPTEEEYARLHLDSDEDVLDLQRAMTADGEVVAYSYDLLPATGITDEIEKSLGEGSMFAAMDRIGLSAPSRNSTQSIRVTSDGDEIDPRAACICSWIRSTSTDQEPRWLTARRTLSKDASSSCWFARADYRVETRASDGTFIVGEHPRRIRLNSDFSCESTAKRHRYFTAIQVFAYLHLARSGSQSVGSRSDLLRFDDALTAISDPA
jgi:GntR family transcriptional regulator